MQKELKIQVAIVAVAALLLVAALLNRQPLAEAPTALYDLVLRDDTRQQPGAQDDDFDDLVPAEQQPDTALPPPAGGAGEGLETAYNG